MALSIIGALVGFAILAVGVAFAGLAVAAMGLSVIDVVLTQARDLARANARRRAARAAREAADRRARSRRIRQLEAELLDVPAEQWARPERTGDPAGRP